MALWGFGSAVRRIGRTDSPRIESVVLGCVDMMLGNPSTELITTQCARSNFGPNRNATPMGGNNDIKRGHWRSILGDRWGPLGTVEP
jgi:hypothetical protein